MKLVVTLEAEQSLIGIILTEPSLIKETILQPNQFYAKENRLIFGALKELDKKGDHIDVVTLLTELGNKANRIGGRQYLSDLLNSVASVEPFKTYEKHILESWKIRQAKKLQEKEIDSLEDLHEITSEFNELQEIGAENEYNHKQAIIDLYDKIESQDKGMSGIDTGFEDLNRMLDGFQGGDLIISAARPSMGKTAKMLSHALTHCKNGGITVIFSLEMGQEQLNKRLLAMAGKINLHKMRNPKQYFNDKDWNNFSMAMGIVSNLNLHIFDKSGQTVQEIRSQVKKLQRQYPNVPMLIQIDYLQLIRSTGRFESKNIEVGEITRSLKELARETNSPVYLLSQLNRGVESRQDKRPLMSDIRDSGSIEQDADVIEFLYRDNYYNPDSNKQNILEVIIAKQRNGAVGTVELYYQKEFNLFTGLEKNYEA